MRPAFSSIKEKAVFVLLLSLILASPLLVAQKILPPRAELYTAAPWGLGAFPYMHDQFFVEKGDIDIAFMGSSPIWWGINTPQVQAALSKQLGRPAVVRSFCWNWNGYDALYFIAKDLLAHRRVHMIVFCDLTPGSSDMAHQQAMHWFRYADNAADLTGLSWRSKASFYTSSMLGVPRNLLASLRPDESLIASNEIAWGTIEHISSPAFRLGSLPQTAPSSVYGPYSDFTPATPADPSEACIYSPATESKFTFASQPLPSLQVNFARKIAALARENHVKLVYLHMPKMPEMGSAVIPENAFWPDIFQSDVAMVGIPFAKLYAGMSQAEVTRFYWDFQHLNLNGQLYFTATITPQLLRVYEDQVKP